MQSRRNFMTQALGTSVAAASALTLASVLTPDKAHAAAPADTQKNLMDAFAGESQANRQYLAFAEQAEKEGLEQAALMFRAIAAAETIHAMNHLHNAGKVGTTLENLKAARGGEVYESTKMYPEMAKTAAAEGKKKEQQYFEWADKVEAEHAKLYQKAIDAQGKLEKVDYYLCSVCGYTHEGAHENNCPICGVASSKFFKFG